MKNIHTDITRRFVTYAVPTAVFIVALCLSHSATARHRHGLKAGPSNGEINRGLRQLAISLAQALGDGEVRAVLDEALSEGSEPTFLSDLLDHQLQDGALFGERLAAAYQPEGDRTSPMEELMRLFAGMADIELSLPFGRDTWDPVAEAPRVTYVAQGPAAEELSSVEIFDVHGDISRIDPRVNPGFTVLVLTYRDVSEYLARREEESRVWAEPAASALSLQDSDCTTVNTYTSYPLFLYAQIRNIHEGDANGPEGFAYFAAAGTEKTGTLPASLGGESGWSTNVWASNFQGPRKVTATRDQWEWTTDGWLEASWRHYPAPYCKQTVSAPSNFSLMSYTIMEDDDTWGNPDDYVGKVRIDHRACKTDVFDTGAISGWSREYPLSGVDDIVTVRYKLYCTHARNCQASVSCPSGSILTCTGSGSCSPGQCISGPNWVECNSHRRYCPRQPPWIP